MSSKNGFTPVPDYLTWKFQDRTLADVYAKVQRFCEMGNAPDCHATKETIAEELSLSEGTIKSRIKTLINNNYVIDLDPQLKNKSHKLIVTDKLEKEETEFWAFAEEYKKDKIVSYLDCFRVYAEMNNIEPHLTEINKPKKPRGKKKGSIVAQSVDNHCLVGRQNIASERSMVDDDNTNETLNTTKTILENSSNFQEATDVTHPSPLEETESFIKDNNNIPLNNKLASSDMDISSESTDFDKKLQELKYYMENNMARSFVKEVIGEILHSFPKTAKQVYSLVDNYPEYT